MTIKELSKKEYKIYYSLYLFLITLVWLSGFMMVLAIIFFRDNNTLSLYISGSFLLILILLATLNEKYNVLFKDYQIKVLKNKLKENGIIKINKFISKEDVLSKLGNSNYIKINNSTYGLLKKSLFIKKLYIFKINECPRFKNFNDSDKLFNKISSTFKIPDISKTPREIKSYIVYWFELNILENVLESDVNNYINETALSIIHKLRIREQGALFDKSNNKLIYYDLKKYDKVLNKLVIDLLKLNN